MLRSFSNLILNFGSQSSLEAASGLIEPLLESAAKKCPSSAQTWGERVQRLKEITAKNFKFARDIKSLTHYKIEIVSTYDTTEDSPY